MPDSDTIAAIATPPGRGGIGIVRLSGPAALALTLPLQRGLPSQPQPAHAYYCYLVEPKSGVKLDEALITYFPAPRSYTGEDVVEIAAHGSPVLLEHVLRLLLGDGQNSIRLAAPGEFTERAFHSGRLDLTQAEAVRDLIEAQTLLQAQVAAQQLGGALSRQTGPLKAELIALIAMLEAGIDFAEDDTPVASDEAIAAKLLDIIAALEPLERSFARGRLLKQGITLAIVGRPNAGKSSLFNRLLERERAIVTAEPGTTRDTVAEQLAIGGIPVSLVDTAGLREAASEAERIGIARSREAFADAGLVLLVLDCTEALNAEEEALLHAAQGRPLLVALNKADLLDAGTAVTSLLDAEERLDPHEPVPKAVPESAPESASGPESEFPTMRRLRQVLQERSASAPLVLCSAQTGAGIEPLRQALEHMLLGKGGITPDTAMLTNLRQHTAISTALTALKKATEAVASSLPHEVILLDLYTALHELDTLTGSTTSDDILHLVFSTFCIGK